MGAEATARHNPGTLAMVVQEFRPGAESREDSRLVVVWGEVTDEMAWKWLKGTFQDFEVLHEYRIPAEKN